MSACQVVFFNRSAELSEDLEVCVFIDSGSSLHEVGQQNTMLIPKHRSHDFAMGQSLLGLQLYRGVCVFPTHVLLP